MRKKFKSEEEHKAYLKELDRKRKERHFAKKLANAPWIECLCGCGEKIKAVDSYGRRKRYISGHNTETKYDDPLEYKRVYARKRYTDPLLKKREQEKKRKYHHQRKAKLIRFKGGECKECGIKYTETNGPIFQFHHLDPSVKEGRIQMWWSWKRTMKELAKCVLLCANCHALAHGDSSY